MVPKGIITQLCTTVQGEGPTAGSSCLLIRVANCNLNCEWCDTKWTNNIYFHQVKALKTTYDLPPFKITNAQERNTFIELCKKHIDNYKIDRVLITGGEPFLNIRFLRNIIDNLYTALDIRYFEIETNGVLFKEDFILKDRTASKIQLNISPKLDPSYYKSENINSFEDILRLHKNKYEMIENLVEDGSLTANYKFIYSKNIENKIDKFIEIIEVNLPIVIMPLTPDYTKYKSETKFFEAYRKSCYDTIDYCLRRNYLFSPRLHIWVFNNFKHRNEFEDVKRS